MLHTCTCSDSNRKHMKFSRNLKGHSRTKSPVHADASKRDELETSLGKFPSSLRFLLATGHLLMDGLDSSFRSAAVVSSDRPIAAARLPSVGDSPQTAFCCPPEGSQALPLDNSERLRLLGREGGGGIREDVSWAPSWSLRSCDEGTLFGIDFASSETVFDSGRDDGRRRFVAMFEAVATALRTANLACFIMD